LWPISRYCPGIFLERLKKTNETSVSLVSVSTEMRSEYLLNRSQKLELVFSVTLLKIKTVDKKVIITVNSVFRNLLKHKFSEVW